MASVRLWHSQDDVGPAVASRTAGTSSCGALLYMCIAPAFAPESILNGDLN